jgi:hypothetical protein
MGEMDQFPDDMAKVVPKLTMTSVPSKSVLLHFLWIVQLFLTPGSQLLFFLFLSVKRRYRIVYTRTSRFLILLYV